MTLLQMKYFAAVCELGNVSKAANELFVSRVTISRTIKELEKEFGLTLFSRTNSGLVMTEQGRVLYGKCLEILHTTDVLHEQMKIIRNRMMPEVAQTLRVGVTPTTAVTVFPYLVDEVRKCELGIKLFSVEYNRLHSLSALENGRIDFHLTADSNLRNFPPSFRRLKLLDTRLVFCMSADHPLCAKEFVTAEDIKDEPLIYLERSYQPEEIIERLYTQIGCFPKVSHRSMQLSTVQCLVQEGFACSIQMENSINDGVRVVARPIEPAVNLEICLVWNEMIPHSKAFAEFLEFVQDLKLPIP